VDRVTFLFDPRSPWCYQTSRWARRLEALGELTLTWGVLSLEVLNLAADEDPAAYDAEYGPALRVAVALRTSHGERAVGDFYRELGALMWEGEVPDGTAAAPPVADLSAAALAAMGVDPGYVDTVLADPATWAAVLDEHRGWIARVRAFGVPTLVFHPDLPGTLPDAADANAVDRAVFGPVLRAVPADDEGCLELWRHVRGIIGNGRIYELKKTKPLSLRADLPAAVWRADLRVADMRAARALMGPGAAHEHSSLEWTMSTVRAAR
jgi:protein-disulfide isomerase-like protein with CxxC motif